MDELQAKADVKQHAAIEAKAAAGDPEAKAFLDQEKAQASAKADGEKFLADVKLKKGVTALPSGVLYETLQAGTGDYPKPTDTVKVNYTGTLINGTKFDSNADHDGGAPAVFPLDGVIPGWTEGIQKVNRGGKIKLYIPSALAYGPRGQPPTIPPDSALVFEVELLDINPAPVADKK
jgi:FKBP-type peptidyl-prolyl cis-trans isomerase